MENKQQINLNNFFLHINCAVNLKYCSIFNLYIDLPDEFHRILNDILYEYQTIEARKMAKVYL